MSDSTVNRVLTVVLVALVLALFATESDARSRVGVTTASDGDPLGKPPDENERILRIGIDVQANELVTTQAKDRAHLVFLDGSSLTVGPNARVIIDRFVYDPASNTGDLTINASRGVFRLVGGRISKQKPIVITTPASTIGIRGGITIVTVTPTETVASFVFGNSMTVTAGGQTRTATRAGSQVTTALGGVPGAPSLLKQGGLGAALNQLEGAVANANTAADQSAQHSGFSRQNSGQPTNAGPSGPPNLSSNTLVNAVNNAGLETQLPTRPTTAVTAAPTVVLISPNGPVAPPPPPGAGPSLQPQAPPSLPPSPPTVGPSRTSQTLTGFAGGLVYGQRSANLTNLLSKPGEVSITTDATNSQAKGTIVVHDLAGSHRHPTATTLQLGGTGGLGAGTSAFIDDKTYIMVTQYNDWSRLSSWQRGGVRQQATDTSVLASAAARPIPFGIPMQGTPAPCVCEFLTWGWWGSKVPDPRDHRRTYTAVGAYVAGTPTTSVQLPQTGSATYSGFMAGVASSHGNTYAAAGSYQNAWNFGSRSGVFNGTFDGRAYSGMTHATYGSNGQAFTGSFSGGNRSGALDGAFFSSPSDPAKYQAGTFSIGNNSSPYKATGVFAGQR
jgi:hypothetical protein